MTVQGPIRDYVFWQNIVSPHQIPYINRLGELGHRVLYVSEQEISADRRDLGWERPDSKNVDFRVKLNRKDILELLDSQSPDTINVIAGARGTQFGSFVQTQCVDRGSKVGIVTEAPDMRGMSRAPKYLKYYLERRKIGHQFDFIFAMGELGVGAFRAFGYPDRMIFPFGYTTSKLKGFDDLAGVDQTPLFDIIYVGQLIQRKNIESLLKAVSRLPGVTLAILGDGARRQSLRKTVQKFEMQSRVNWLGVRKPAEVLKYIAMSRILVLPSWHDGWGAVVNESLSMGTPVVCSKQCGASDLVYSNKQGRKFNAHSIDDLEQCIVDLLSSRHNVADRLELIECASRFSGDVMGDYFDACINSVYASGDRPRLPWL